MTAITYNNTALFIMTVKGMETPVFSSRMAKKYFPLVKKKGYDIR